MLHRKTDYEYEAERSSFERDLLEVLKHDPDRKLDFNGKLLFRSRRFDCLLAAVDVHYSQENGDVVMIGIHCFVNSNVSDDELIPFSECYDDLRLSCDNEAKLLAMIRKAVNAKYIDSYFNWMKARGLVKDSAVDLVSLDVGSFRVEFVWSDLLGIKKDKEGNIILSCYNSFRGNFDLNPDLVPMTDLQSLGDYLAGACELLEDKYEIVDIVSDSEIFEDGCIVHQVDVVDSVSVISDSSSLSDEPESLFIKALRLFGLGR